MKAPIGARVSIRFHDPEGGFRDLVGYLESENSLRNRHGELIEFDVKKIEVNSDKTYVMVCQRGFNSYKATVQLKEKYPTLQVLNLTGGISNY